MSDHASEERRVNVAVVGPGAVGTVIAYSLNAVGIKPYLVFRTAAQAKAAAEHGVKVIVNNSLESVDATPVPQHRLGGKLIDVAFLTVKAYDVTAAARSVRPSLRDGAVVVICQNGLGVVERVLRVLGRGFRYVRAVLNLGAFRRGGGVVKLAGIGESYVGSVGGDEGTAEEVASMLRELNVKPVKNVWRYVWLKLAVNAGINPVTALLGITNGELLRIRTALAVATEAALEVGSLARVRGIALPKDPVSEVVRVAEATSGNRSSMLQDVLAGRRTEVDYINGAACLEGLKDGVEMRVNCVLWALVKSLEGRHRLFTVDDRV